ncbi:MAG: host attachment protein [Sulfurovum sp.]|nr:host attachment protein [Sulfurovum sp.]
MTLENTIIIVADLGELKAFKVEEHKGTVRNQMKISHSLELINDEVFISGRKKLGEVMSASSGKFAGDTLDGHHVMIEREKRTIKDIVQDIDMIVKEMQPEQVFLAFPKEHNHELTDKLSQETKAVLAKNVAADLVKINKEKLLSHFE